MQSHKFRFTFHTLKRDKMIQRYHSSSIRRFRNHIGTINWQNRDFKVYLRVGYGDRFYNAGIYENQKDFLFALDTFADPAIPKYLYDE